MAAPEQTEHDKKVIMLAQVARNSRNHFEAAYNTFLDLALPMRQRIGEDATIDNPQTPTEQDGIFDTTLQEAVGDWASDCSDEFTPGYKAWTTLEAMGGTKQFTKAVQDQILEEIEARTETIYGKIRQSNFGEQSQGVYEDLAMMPSGLDMPYTKSGEKLKFEHVPCAQLLIMPSPFGGPGDRFRERKVAMKDLDAMFPKASFDHLGSKEARSRITEAVTVLQAFTREWENRSEEVWTYGLYVENRRVQDLEVTRGAGSCRLQVVRPAVSAPTAYGVGTANKAIPPARTLDELAYLELKRTGKVVDPPYIYADDGTINLEGGIEAGDWLVAGPDFKVESLAPNNDGREAWFKQEDLRAAVRRALFQDKPYQRGDTPPTATQWMDEQAMNARRKSFPRERIVLELVLPVIRRVDWILTKRGELQPFTAEGELVRFEPISPMSRASDLEEVQMADRHMSMFAERFGEQVMDYYDLPATMVEVRKKLGTKVLKLRTQAEVDEIQNKRMQEQALAAAAPGMLQNGMDNGGAG
jgi:hypothetical protein